MPFTLHFLLLCLLSHITAGTLFNWVIKISLSDSWGISTGILACMGAGIYELGCRDGDSSD
jgi:hypothetical protein